MTQMTRQQMTEFDARELEYITRRDEVMLRLASFQDRVHPMVRDKRQRFGSRTWELTDQQAEELLEQHAAGDDAWDARISMRPSEMIILLAQTRDLISVLNGSIEAMENEYRKAPWQRYFPCLNADGHIHATLRACPTVRLDTSMGWAVQYSGLTADEAIHGVPGEFEGLGETLCSVCFPGAPAEWCRTRSEITRAEREAAKAVKDAERDAVKAAKNLAEPFRAWDGDRITTVAAAKAAVRRPAETQVELEWNKTLEASSRWEDQESYQAFIARMERRLEMERADAVQLSYILIAREAAAPGTGWSRADQDKAFADALKRNRRAWFK